MMPFERRDVLLSVQNVELSFGEKVILKNINMEIRDLYRPGFITGQVVSLVGKSGIGKSQLFRRLAGLHIRNATTSGKVLVGEDQKPVKPGDMGVVPQDYYLPPHLTVSRILWHAAVKNPAFKGNNKTITDAITSYLLEFELGDHKSKFPIQLSGGQRQRTSIAMQLLSGSHFLLMDEPFSGLDPLMIDKTISLLLRVSQSNELSTIIIVSHDLRNSIAISDTAFILSDRETPKQGATIIEEVDLVGRGLAWNPDIKELPEFLETIREIKALL